MKKQILMVHPCREAYEISGCGETLTTKELRKILATFPDDMPIYLKNNDDGYMLYGSIARSDLRTEMINQTMTYQEKEPLVLSKTDFERIQELLKVNFEQLEYLEGEELEKYQTWLYRIDARPETCPYTLRWEFTKPNKILEVDITSTDTEYHLEFRLYDPITDKTYYGDDWSWDWAEKMEIEMDGDVYQFSLDII